MTTLSRYDYWVIGFYFLYMTLIGWVCRRFIRDTSDYFRGGGKMLWWMAGSSAFMVSFSAWTFTGAAGKAYEDGPVVMVIFFANAVGFFFNYIFFAPRFRQLRVVTSMQAVRARFGAGSEQFFTWLQIPLGMLYAGIWLNGARGVCLGGVQSRLATDHHRDRPRGVDHVRRGRLVGGRDRRLRANAHPHARYSHRGVSGAGAGGRLVGVRRKAAASLLQLVGGRAVGNHLAVVDRDSDQAIHFDKQPGAEASRYLNVKGQPPARWAGLLGCGLFLVGPLVWFIPPMVARITHSDLAPMFPHLSKPSEAAFVATCMDTMPAGMVGLIISGIFAATMSSMDAGLNRNAGFFVKNFYQPVLRATAHDKELLLVGKLTTLLLGVLVILAALTFSSWKDMKLFDLMLQFGGLIALPYSRR